MPNKNDSYQTYRTFVPSQCVGLNAGITFNPPPKALYISQTASGGKNNLGVQYRNLDGEIILIKAIDGAGELSTILEIGDCRQVVAIVHRSTPGNAAGPDDSVTGLY